MSWPIKASTRPPPKTVDSSALWVWVEKKIHRKSPFAGGRVRFRSEL
jgi:hypothetical protein